MIYTCTVNPAIDYHLYSQKFEKGKLNRASMFHYELGGKGINVSKTLSKLQQKSVCLSFIDQFYLTKLKHEFYHYRYIVNGLIKTKSDIRINIKLHDNMETEINTSMQKPQQKEIYKFVKKLTHITNNDILIISGSGMKDEPYIYESMLSQSKKRSFNLIVDTPAVYYDQFFKYKPIMMKPNLQELEEYFNVKIPEKEIVDYCKKLIAKGAQNVIVSLGSNGSMLVTDNKSYHIKMKKLEAVNTVGAGDAFVAGFIYYYQASKNVMLSYKYGHATAYTFLATNNAFNKMDVKKYLDEIKVEELIDENE